MPMSTLVMVRTVCCETYKCSGTRCSICPHRPENKEALQQYQSQPQPATFGRRLRIPSPTVPAAASASQS